MIARYQRIEKKRKDFIKSWEGFIPKESNCKICNKKIFFNKKDRDNSIHFDHRNEGKEIIKCIPSQWLKNNECNIDNQELWNSCDFGILCRMCNLNLPTRNREDYLNRQKAWLEGALKYMAEKSKDLASPREV